MIVQLTGPISNVTCMDAYVDRNNSESVDTPTEHIAKIVKTGVVIGPDSYPAIFKKSLCARGHDAGECARL